MFNESTTWPFHIPRNLQQPSTTFEPISTIFNVTYQAWIRDLVICPKLSSKIFSVFKFSSYITNQPIRKMNSLKISLIFSYFVTRVLLTNVCIQQVQQIHVEKIRCNASDKFVYPNFTCEVKIANKTCSTTTVIGWAKMPMNKIYVSKTFKLCNKNSIKMFFHVKLEATLYYEYGKSYRMLLRTPRVEFCSLLKSNNSNILIDQLIKIVKDSVPDIIHDCPYNVRSWVCCVHGNSK